MGAQQYVAQRRRHGIYRTLTSSANPAPSFSGWPQKSERSGNVRSVGFDVGQPAARDPLDEPGHPRNLGVLAVRVAEVNLHEVAREMLDADVMVRAVD